MAVHHHPTGDQTSRANAPLRGAAADGSHRMALFLVDHARRQLLLRVGQGSLADDLDLTYTDLQAGISGLAFQSKQPMLSLHPDDGIESETTRERRRQIAPGPIIVVPLVAKDAEGTPVVIGTITRSTGRSNQRSLRTMSSC
jgi:hypothetical protein